MGATLTALWIANTIVFVLYVRSRRYQMFWAVVGALILGPLIWPGWVLMRYGQRRGEAFADQESDHPRTSERCRS